MHDPAEPPPPRALEDESRAACQPGRALLAVTLLAPLLACHSARAPVALRPTPPTAPRGAGAAPPLRQEEAAGESEERRRNFVGAFVGVTDRDESSGGSVALAYERFLSPRVGIGMIFEVTPTLEERIVTAPGLFLRPYGPLSLVLAPGVQKEEGEERFLFRVGAGWEIELGGGFSLAPEFNYDIIVDGDDAIVLGFTFGYAF